jgi:hypothetical protein
MTPSDPLRSSSVHRSSQENVVSRGSIAWLFRLLPAGAVASWACHPLESTAFHGAHALRTERLHKPNASKGVPISQNHYFLFAKGLATSRAQSMTS